MHVPSAAPSPRGRGRQFELLPEGRVRAGALCALAACALATSAFAWPSWSELAPNEAFVLGAQEPGSGVPKEDPKPAPSPAEQGGQEGSEKQDDKDKDGESQDDKQDDKGDETADDKGGAKSKDKDGKDKDKAEDDDETSADKSKSAEEESVPLQQPAGPVLLLQAERVIVRPGHELQNAAVLVVGGRIAAVGVGLAAPEGARTIQGRVVCAGFLDPWTSLGIDEASAEDRGGTADTRTVDAIDPFGDAHLARQALRAGVTAVRAQAAGRALVAGQGAILPLHPEPHARAQALLADACMGATIGQSGGDIFERVAEVDRLIGEIESGRRYRESQVEYRYELEEWQKKIDEQLKELEKNAKKAQKDREKEQADAKEKGKEFKEKAYKEDKRPNAPAPNPQDEAMARVAHGEIPLIVELQRAAELRALLDGTRNMPRLRLVLAGAREAAPFASELAERGIPVIVLPAPPGDAGIGREHELALAATLQQAGVEVLIGSGGERSYTRDLPQLAAMAIGNGLDAQAAFSALTLGAARTLDVSDRLGSVERGKQADLLVLDGDPLQTRTRVQFVIARGEVVVEP